MGYVLMFVGLAMMLFGCSHRWCGLPLPITPDVELLDVTAEAIELYPPGYVEINDYGVPLEFTDRNLRSWDNACGETGCAHWLVDLDGCVFAARIQVRRASSKLIAHEIGHLFGVPHMGDESCISNPDCNKNAILCEEVVDYLNAIY
jgi:hypothetical protein